MQRIDCMGGILIQQYLCYRVKLVLAFPGRVNGVHRCAGNKGWNLNSAGLCAAVQTPEERLWLERGKIGLVTSRVSSSPGSLMAPASWQFGADTLFWVTETLASLDMCELVQMNAFALDAYLEKHVGIFPAFVLIFMILSRFLYPHWRKWVYLASCSLCRVFMGDFNQTSLLVLHLLQHRLVGMTLVAIPLWGQWLLNFWDKCLHPSCHSRKEAFAHTDLEVYLLGLFKSASVPWGGERSVCALSAWGHYSKVHTGTSLCLGTTWRICRLCQVVFSICPVWWGVTVLHW